MKLKLYFLGLLCFLFSLTANAANISEYRPLFIIGYDQKNQMQIAIRSYRRDQQNRFLLVNPYTLSTKTINATHFKKNLDNQTKLKQSLSTSPYFKALKKYSQPPYLLENYGLTHADYPVDSMFLTIDMCPSSKTFERNFFETLISLADKNHQAIPIALSVSGLWMIKHPQEFDWLIAQQKAHKLAITWVNHSYTHVYIRNLPPEKNFMLIQPENFINEVLENEKILLMKHRKPSIFFRFPGLVANKELIIQLNNLGLIPLGSDAWLAKGQSPQEGSIILVHGNSNEPLGIQKILPLLQEKTLHLLPLKKTLIPNSLSNKVISYFQSQ